MKVERPRARSSAAPTRLKRRSTTPRCALSAGTKEPICASTAMSAFWRRKVALARHVGPGQQPQPPAVAQVAVIGDEGVAGHAAQRRLDHGMAALADVERQAVIDDGPAIALAHRQLGQARRHVERGKRRSGAGDLGRARNGFGSQILEIFQLQGQRLVGRRGDPAFELGQLDRRVAHRRGQGLAMDEALADLRGLRGRHLDVVAEHVVVTDFERRARRSRRHSAPAIRRPGAGFRRVSRGARRARARSPRDEAAIAGIERKLGSERAAEAIDHRMRARRDRVRFGR